MTRPEWPESLDGTDWEYLDDLAAREKAVRRSEQRLYACLAAVIIAGLSVGIGAWGYLLGWW